MLNQSAERWLPFTDAMLFDLAADFEQYPRYLPGWRSVWIDWREGERLQAEQAVGFGPVRLRFRTTATLRRPHSIEVTSVDPKFSHFRLMWVFEAATPRGCRVGLSVELELRARLLQRAVESVPPDAAETVLDAFARRAGELFGPQPARRVT